jgi:hypothetical protein
MSQNMTDLMESYSLYDQRFGPDLSLKRLTGLFISLQNLTVEWANTLDDTISDLASHCITFFKYMRHETYSFKELWAKTQRFEDDYLLHRKNLNKKKERLLASGDPARMEIQVTDMKGLSKEDLKDKEKLAPLVCGR